MRFLLLFGASLFLSCKATESVPQVQPVVVHSDSVATVATYTVGKKSTVTIQVGTGNQATTAKTNNEGRSAEAGANGGHSVATTTTATPLWVFGACIVLGFAVRQFGPWLVRAILPASFVRTG